ncbi:ester cyclase [Bacillus sp. ISL-18]|uniref:ester cyclase n=1 Tax=Bacillus sp. ISL-18 TaxID=2819118 RepID=UPI001BE786F0|nr:ester cyclase [Bacillus sp. ISL-18]MBT2653981.1 ester cyclase [Bacillus sp. ISL-18]
MNNRQARKKRKPCRFRLGDQEAVYFIFEGTHTGIPFFSITSTGSTVRFSLMMFLRFKNGKIIEKRSHVDVNDILSQLGTTF